MVQVREERVDNIGWGIGVICRVTKAARRSNVGGAQAGPGTGLAQRAEAHLLPHPVTQTSCLPFETFTCSRAKAKCCYFPRV